MFFEHRTLYPVKQVPEEIEPIELGKARVHREGEDVTVVATGRLVHESLAAADEADEPSISVEVIDADLQPLDEETVVASVAKTSRCVVAHEAVVRMGWGPSWRPLCRRSASTTSTPGRARGGQVPPIPFAPVMEEFVIPHKADIARRSRTVERG